MDGPPTFPPWYPHLKVVSLEGELKSPYLRIPLLLFLRLCISRFLFYFALTRKNSKTVTIPMWHLTSGSPPPRSGSNRPNCRESCSTPPDCCWLTATGQAQGSMMSLTSTYWSCSGAMLCPHKVPRSPPSHARIVRAYLTWTHRMLRRKIWCEGCSWSPSSMVKRELETIPWALRYTQCIGRPLLNPDRTQLSVMSGMAR